MGSDGISNGHNKHKPQAQPTQPTQAQLSGRASPNSGPFLRGACAATSVRAVGSKRCRTLLHLSIPSLPSPSLRYRACLERTQFQCRELSEVHQPRHKRAANLLPRLAAAVGGRWIATRGGLRWPYSTCFSGRDREFAPLTPCRFSAGGTQHFARRSDVLIRYRQAYLTTRTVRVMCSDVLYLKQGTTRPGTYQAG